MVADDGLSRRSQKLLFLLGCTTSLLHTIAAPQATVFLGWPEIFLQLSSLLPPAQPVSQRNRISRTQVFSGFDTKL